MAARTAAKTEGPVTIHHPTLEGVSYDVPAADADRWVEQGWRKTPPAASSDDES